MNAATSQEVFAGPYLTDPVKRQKFSDCFQDMTQGFLAFPLCIPGTAVWKGKQGRLWIIDLLEEAAGKSKAAMKVGFGACSAWIKETLCSRTGISQQSKFIRESENVWLRCCFALLLLPFCRLARSPSASSPTSCGS